MKPLLLLILLGAGLHAGAATYYFSSTLGDDRRTPAEARHAATPWRSLEKLQALLPQLRPGDTVRLRRGDRFFGSLNITVSGAPGRPIVFTAYGNGPLPVITGLAAAGSWRAAGRGRYFTILPTSDRPGIVLIGGQPVAMGRTPNADAPNGGYWQAEEQTDPLRFHDTQLTRQPDWSGAEVVLRTRHWVIDRRRVRSCARGWMELDTAATYRLPKNYGYFVQDDLRSLDQWGEWYFDKSGQRLYLCFGERDPAATRVEASVLPVLIRISGQSWLSFEQLALHGASEDLMVADNAGHLVVRSCVLSAGGRRAITGAGLTESRIENNRIRDLLNDGIYLSFGSHSNSISGNDIRNVLPFPGMCRSGNTTGLGIYANGKAHTVTGNRIDSCGFTPIRFGGDDVVIRNNIITRFNYVKDDEGGIYTWNNNPGAPLNKGRRIENNMVLHGIGAPQGTEGKSCADGIYLDDNSGGVAITGNTVAWCSHYGIYIHDAHHTAIRNNTCYGNRLAQLMFRYDEVAPNGVIRETELSGNIFAGLDPNQPLVRYESIRDDIRLMGTASKNLYARPGGAADYFALSYRDDGKQPVSRSWTLAQWQKWSGRDAGSQARILAAGKEAMGQEKALPAGVWPFRQPSLSATNENLLFLYNTEARAIGQMLSGGWRDLQGRSYAGRITMAPFSSVILVRDIR